MVMCGVSGPGLAAHMTVAGLGVLGGPCHAPVIAAEIGEVLGRPAGGCPVPLIRQPRLAAVLAGEHRHDVDVVGAVAATQRTATQRTASSSWP